MNETISHEEVSQAIANLSEGERAFTEEQFEHFFPLWIEETQKKNFVKKLVKNDKDFIFGVLQISSITQDDIDKVKEEVVYFEALDIVDAIRRKDPASVDNAIRFYSNNLKKTVTHYEEKIEEYKISKLPKKKAEQFASLIATGRDEAAKMIITDHINSKNFKWSEQLMKISEYMEVLKSDLNFDIRLFSADAINANPDLIKNIAYALCFPDYQLGFLIQQTLENISPIPYDWYLQKNLSISMYKKTVDEMAEDFTSVANVQYSIACSRIMKNSSVPVLGIRKRKNLILELLSLLEEKRFESARIVSFVLIEGLLWQLVNEINKKEEFIVSKSNDFLDLSGSEFQSARIREVIERTTVSKYVDSDFMKHFCEELYEERNPVLHGGDQCYTCPNAGMCLLGKIFVLDYIIEKLITLQKENIFSSWDKMPDDVRNRVLSTFIDKDVK